MNHIGTQILETDRLILRRFTTYDASEMYTNWASCQDVTKYLTWQPHKSIGESASILENWQNQYEYNTYYHWAIVHKKTNQAIGSISLQNLNELVKACSVGYCIGKLFWNKGITTEVFKKVIEFAFEKVGFVRIQAIHYLGNEASGMVMKKAGLSYEGIRRKSALDNMGNIIDCKVYAITDDDYKKMKKLS